MYRIHSLVMVVAALGAGLLGCAPPAPLRVMSFNIRYANPGDGENRWDNRRAAVVELIRGYDPDVLAVQEALASQAAELRAALPGYGFVGVGREDGAERGEFVPVLYRQSRFAPVDHGTFWLSEHPEQIGSVGWDAALPRIATWVRLRGQDAARRELLVIAIHFDHQGQRARLESARLLRGWIQKQGDVPLILLGDFNTPPESEPHQVLTLAGGDGAGLRDAHIAVACPLASEGTYHAFTGQPQDGRIDWILYSRQLEALAADVIRTHRAGHYPSDHFPVTATLRYVR